MLIKYFLAPNRFIHILNQEPLKPVHPVMRTFLLRNKLLSNILLRFLNLFSVNISTRILSIIF